ncbi:hypothetical protein B1L04_09485 [Microcystis aeruginosa KW]|uniref:Uncharacterized protein n=1 Tax=Microcystis aeruginosa KW TaxID=1960155 RepID=A0A1V4BY48_MICAE|nr:hypothetical protein B1L04_09485 [Microcystis aeruginosa KW]
MGKTPHPTPHTLPPRKTFCRKPYLNNPSLPKRKTSYLIIKITTLSSFLTQCPSTGRNADSWLKPVRQGGESN